MSEEYKIRKKETKNIIIEVPKDINCEIIGKKLVFIKNNISNEVIFNTVYLQVKLDNNVIELIPKNSRKKTKAVLNTTNKLILNAIKGLNEEFIYKLKIVYSHFPITVKTDGNFVVISNFLGEKKPRKTKIINGCKVSIDGREIIVKGHNKYSTGQTAGNIEKVTRVTNKDYRVFDDGCYIVEKPHTRK
jgi:large subunit ribosomal protein L6